MDSIALAWFLRQLSNSSSFSAILLKFQAGLHGLHSSGMVLAAIVKLILLLGNFAVNLLLGLSKLELGSQNLILLLLKSSLSLLIGGLHPEHLRAVVSGLGPAGLKLRHEVLSLDLPFVKDLLEVVSSLLTDGGGSVSSLILHGNLLQLSLQAVDGLLILGNLAIQTLNLLLGLKGVGTNPLFRRLKFINLATGLNLILGFPELNLSLGLGKSLDVVILLIGLLLYEHLEPLTFRAQVFELGQNIGSVISLRVGQPLGVLKLGGQ